MGFGELELELGRPAGAAAQQTAPHQLASLRSDILSLWQVRGIFFPFLAATGRETFFLFFFSNGRLGAISFLRTLKNRRLG